MKKCIVCDANVDLNYIGKSKNKIIETGLCYNCLFWSEVVTDIKNPEERREEIEEIWITEEFNVYYSNKDNKNYPFQGPEGTKLYAHMKDGTVSEGDNVWSRDVLPEIWREGIIPNVDFVSVKNPKEEER